MHAGGRSFYNPGQELNRDVSVLALGEFLKDHKDAKVLEAMSATGIRGIRYAKTLDPAFRIFFNDSDSLAVEEIWRNLALKRSGQQQDCGHKR